MKKSLVVVFAAFCGLSLMNACTPDETGDAGVEDAGGEGEGEGEGEQPGAEGDTCAPADTASCETGLVCVAGQLTPNVGTCRVDCSGDENACGAGRTCQDVLNASLEPVAVACVPPQPARDGQCTSAGDPDACADPLQCLITSADTDDLGNFTATQNCKLLCDLDADDPAAACPAEEGCFPSTLIQGGQPDPNNPQDLLACTEANCAADGTGCECDTEAGFDCVELTTGFRCVAIPGMCGTPVPPVEAEMLVPGGIQPNFVCNNVEDHAFCDNSMIAADDGEAACITGVFGASAPNDGLCLAICSVPDVDRDQNGAVEGAEVGEFIGCVEGWECSTAASIELIVGATIEDTTGTFGLKECAPANCTEGEPCPSECGAGDYECVSLETQNNGTVSLCLAAFGSCVPSDAPGVDAGPQDEDAGPTEDDAGSTETDAGPDAVEDAGDSDAN